MPVSFTIDRTNDVVLRTARGEITAEQLAQNFEEVLAHPDFHAGIKSLTDARELDHHLEVEDMRDIAKTIARYRDRIAGGRAAVVVSIAVSYGLMRALQAYADQSPIDIRIFYDVDEARRWLGIEAL